LFSGAGLDELMRTTICALLAVSMARDTTICARLAAFRGFDRSGMLVPWARDLELA